MYSQSWDRYMYIYKQINHLREVTNSYQVFVRNYFTLWVTSFFCICICILFRFETIQQDNMWMSDYLLRSNSTRQHVNDWSLPMNADEVIICQTSLALDPISISGWSGILGLEGGLLSFRIRNLKHGNSDM